MPDRPVKLTRHDPECRDPSCELCQDVTGPLVDYEVLEPDGEDESGERSERAARG